jgi:hypothetical protein
MARSRRLRSEESEGEFDDVLDGKPPFVSDGGPYVYHFHRLERRDAGGVFDLAPWRRCWTRCRLRCRGGCFECLRRERGTCTR